MKYWQVLLKEWRKAGKTGLTVPYLVGAQYFFSDVNHNHTIEDLITDMFFTTAYETYITYCMDINQ